MRWRLSSRLRSDVGRDLPAPGAAHCGLRVCSRCHERSGGPAVVRLPMRWLRCPRGSAVHRQICLARPRPGRGARLQDKWLRIFSMAARSTMAVMILSCPAPPFGQCCMAISKTRLSSRAQPMCPARAWTARASPSHRPSLPAGLPESSISSTGLAPCGTTCDRKLAWPARGVSRVGASIGWKARISTRSSSPSSRPGWCFRCWKAWPQKLLPARPRALIEVQQGCATECPGTWSHGDNITVQEAAMWLPRRRSHCLRPEALPLLAQHFVNSRRCRVFAGCRSVYRLHAEGIPTG